MSKIIALSLLLLTVSYGSMTQKFPFIGVSVTTEEIDIKPSDKKRETGISLRYGQQTQEWRTTFSLEHHGSAYNSFAVEIDKILLDEMFGTPKLRPYLGGALGYMKFDDKNDVYDESNGFYYGGRFGFIIYAGDDADIDIGYHYYKVENLDFVDDMHGASAGIHYFF